MTAPVLRKHLAAAGRKGAAAYFENSTPAQRKRRARKAARARWDKVRSERISLGENSA